MMKSVITTLAFALLLASAVAHAATVEITYEIQTEYTLVGVGVLGPSAP